MLIKLKILIQENKIKFVNKNTFIINICLRVWLQLFFKVFFVLKCIKMIFFLFLKKLFLRSANQNNPKHIKKINFQQKRKNKLNFLRTNRVPQTMPNKMSFLFPCSYLVFYYVQFLFKKKKNESTCFICQNLIYIK